MCDVYPKGAHFNKDNKSHIRDVIGISGMFLAGEETKAAYTTIITIKAISLLGRPTNDGDPPPHEYL
eukprot:scaffold23464_cov126-Cylindrotheca_fusiformis.AAC.9